MLECEGVSGAVRQHHQVRAHISMRFLFAQAHRVNGGEYLNARANEGGEA